MSWRAFGFALAVVGGIALAACGAAYGIWPLQVVGLALIMGCIYLGSTWIAAQNKPPAIKPAANPAWSMRDEATASEQKDALTPGPSPTGVGEGRN